MVSPGLGDMITSVGEVEGGTTLLVTAGGFVLIDAVAALIVVVGSGVLALAEAAAAVRRIWPRISPFGFLVVDISIYPRC